MPTFSQKKVWHSHLKQKSPIRLKFRGIPRNDDGSCKKSEYGDYYQAFIEVAGDDKDDYYYVCEDEHIKDAILEAPQDVWVIVTAAGGKDSQHLDIKADDGTAVVVSGDSKPTKTQRDRGSFAPDSLLEGYTGCFQLAERFIDERLAGELDTERFNLIKELGTTFYIQWARGGFSVPLEPGAVEPTVVPTQEGVAQADPPTSEVGDVAEKLSQLPKKNGTSHDGKQLKRVTDAMEEQLNNDPTNEQIAKMNAWLDAELRIQMLDGVGEFVPEDDLPF